MMVEVNLIQFFANFFINDLFGNYILGVLFVIILILAFITITNAPKAAWLIIPTIVIMGFSVEGIYVPQWIGVIMWAAMGLLWGIILKKVIS